MGPGLNSETLNKYFVAERVRVCFIESAQLKWFSLQWESSYKMASRNFNSPFQPIERLVGRDNYRSWAISMRAYLEVEDLWDTMEAPLDGQLSTDAKKLQKARGRLVLAVEPDVHAYIGTSQTPKDIWSELAKTFDDKGLNSKVNLLKKTATRWKNMYRASSRHRKSLPP